MSFHAIHKPTGKIVSIYQLEKDPQWIGKGKSEEWIARKVDINNWNEIGDREVQKIYVKKGIDGKSAHFRINDSEARSFEQNESPEHRRIKDEVYNSIIENNVSFFCENKIFYPDDLPIEDVHIEYIDTYTGKRADVSVEFKEEHHTFGKGIIIEIQLSYQNHEKTIERTYEKILGGYSICWMFKEDYKTYFKNKKSISVMPFYAAIEKAKKEFGEKEQQRVNQLGESINEKIEEMNRKEKNMLQTFRAKEEQLNNLQEEINKRRDQVYENLKKISEKEIIKEAKNEVSEKINKNINIENIKSSIIDEVRDKIQAKSDEEIIKANKEYEKAIGQVYDKIKSINDRMEQSIRGKEEEIKNRVKKDFENDFREKFKPEVLAEKLQEELYQYYSELRLGMDAYRKKLETLLREDYDRIEFWRKEIDNAKKKGDKRVTSKKLSDFSKDKDPYSKEVNENIKKNGEPKQ